MVRPFCRLLRFKRYSDRADVIAELKSHPVVLVVAPLSGHHSTMVRDTVKSLLQAHKVYVTDWMDARMVPLSEGPFTLDQYVGYIQDFIRHGQLSVGHAAIDQRRLPSREARRTSPKRFDDRVRSAATRLPGTSLRAPGSPSPAIQSVAVSGRIDARARVPRHGAT